MHRIQSLTRWRYASLVIVSLLLAFLHAGPLHGSRAALVLVVLGQLYLPGWLLARALGRHAHPHPIVRFVWVLLAGLGLTIPIAGLCFLLRLPVPAYLLLLHGVMLALALLPPRAPAPETPWRLTWPRAPLYVLVALVCLITLLVGSAGRYRFWGFEDQTVFISLADWLANNPGEFPGGLPLRTRQVAHVTNDTRQDTDGWTYSHAAWSWSSGVSASDIIWYDLNPLFLWVVPLITFALAYEITQRETAAAWSAAALVLAGLLALDNIVYYPPYTTYGRFAVFQVNSLRQMALTVMLPLAWLAAFAYLRAPRRWDVPLIFLAGLALAMLHPVPVMLFQMSAGAALVVRWLAQPSRARARQLAPLLVVLVLLLALPFIQRLNRAGLSAADSLIRTSALAGDEAATSTGHFMVLRDLPVFGTTFIRNPSNFFYHPFIAAAALLGLAFTPVWRRSLAAQFIVPAAVGVLLLAFTPGLTAFFNGFASSLGLLLTLFMLPVPLIFGLTFDNSLRWLAARVGRVPAYGYAAAAVAVGAALLALLVEPFPITASARDQLEAYNTMQVDRQVQPFQDALIASLRRVLPDDQTNVLAVPYNVTSVVLDEVSGTLITGGRRTRSPAYAADLRFFGRSTPPAPWLDTADLTFLNDFGVTHLVVEASSPRLPQLVMQPERFTLLDRPAGYYVFAVTPHLTPDEVDAAFAGMNAVYGANPPIQPADGFALGLPAEVDSWLPLVEQWQALAENAPDDPRARLGLAYSALLAGDYDTAAGSFMALHAVYPALPAVTDGAAYALAAADDAPAALPLLLAALDQADAAASVLAARTLLTRSFFYLLNPDQMAHVLAATRAHRLAWQHLVVFDQPDATRRRAALLLAAGQPEAAEQTLLDVLELRRGAQDVLTLAALALARGEVSTALDRLRPATDDRWLMPRRTTHPDRWRNNVAAQGYYLLTGDLAARENRLEAAITAYQQAIEAGASLAGRVFLARALEQTGQTDRATALRAEAEALWRETHDSPLPELVSLLALAGDSGVLNVLNVTVEHGADEREVIVTASYGNWMPRATYPIQSWRVEIISPDSQTRYASVDVPAVLVDAALVRVPVTVRLPDDVPPLAPALAYVRWRHDDAITSPGVTAATVLHRPDAAALPSDAVPVSRQFGDSITLLAYTLDEQPDKLTVTLYWQADAPLPEDYQVFVHLVGADGAVIQQRDGAPVDNRYPTGQWRVGVPVADTHTFSLEPPPAYTLRVGLYRLSDLTRLPVTPADERVTDSSLRLVERP